MRQEGVFVPQLQQLTAVKKDRFGIATTKSLAIGVRSHLLTHAPEEISILSSLEYVGISTRVGKYFAYRTPSFALPKPSVPMSRSNLRYPQFLT